MNVLSRMRSAGVACIILLLCSSVGFSATVQLDAPQRVARGDAFLVTAVSNAPATKMVFFWRDKSWTVPALLENGRYVSHILLAVPVDGELPDALPLVVRAEQGTETRRTIAFYSKDRPVQQLTVEKKYVNPPAHEQQRIAEDRRKVQATLAKFTPERCWSLPLLRPVPGEISSLYGLKRIFNGQPRSVHKGLDLRGAQGDPILAAADGTVALADDLYFSGNAVYVDHGLGVFTAYLHMSEMLVSPGQKVQRGQVLGRVGATGRVTGPHLHLSLLVQGTSVDPEPLLARF